MTEPSGQPNTPTVTENMGTGDAGATDSFGVDQDQSSEANVSITERDVPFLSDADIDAALENGLGDQDESGEEGEESASPKDDDDSTGEDGESKEASDSEAQEGGESEEGGTESKEDIETLRKALEKKNRQVADQQQFIQRQNQRYGDLKKQLNGQLDALIARVDEMTEAEKLEAGPAIAKLREQINNVKSHEEMFNHVVQTQETVFKVIPPEDFDVEGMASELEAVGGDATYISQFKENPFAVAKAHEIIMLHRAYKNAKAMRVLATALKAERKEKEALKAKPKQMLKNINKVAVNSNGVTGKNSGGTSRNERLATLSEREIANLSDAELDRLYAESKRLGR